MSELIIIGNGKLADAIYDDFSNFSIIPVKKYEPNIKTNQSSIFVHVGSGRQYEESLKQAIINGSSYIQAATEKDIKMTSPTDKNFKFINAPNLDINIIKLFYWLKSSKNLFEGEAISILESHQKEKKSQPGTAMKICDYLNIPYERIVSIRDPKQQKKLNIINLNHHAYHQIQIGDNDSKITIETKIEGTISYVKGLSKIIKCISKLDKGNYEIEELLDLNLL